MAERGPGGDVPEEDSGNIGAGDKGGRNSTSQGDGSATSSEQILQTGSLLLRGFIADRVQRSPNMASADVPELGNTEELQCGDSSTKRLSECLRKIGDELDGNMELQRMIEQVQNNPPKEVFFRVATQMFADGNFNWGRVVALFYFACKLVLKALCTHVPHMIRTIINWTMEYLREHVLQWIRDQGGWEGLLSYFGTPTWQTVSVFLAGVLTASFAIYRMS
ncbi:apoptosis regulator BAX [Bombina bombina]|uniref:apoptosis regulator BAX n=1 Tax=Bombina bombina TaxID=8345 RepID=UPI00235A7CD6|nr:apoptosis regulator BAX [Bombina bombina]